jgi:hypothetical protein
VLTQAAQASAGPGYAAAASFIVAGTVGSAATHEIQSASRLEKILLFADVRHRRSQRIGRHSLIAALCPSCAGRAEQSRDNGSLTSNRGDIMKHTLQTLAFGIGMLTAVSAFADPSISLSGVPEFFHAGTKACHFAVSGSAVLGVDETAFKGGPAQCGAIMQAFLGQRNVTYSLSGGTVPCSTSLCAGGTAAEVSDIVLGFAP